MFLHKTWWQELDIKMSISRNSGSLRPKEYEAPIQTETRKKNIPKMIIWDSLDSGRKQNELKQMSAHLIYKSEEDPEPDDQWLFGNIGIFHQNPLK